MNQKPSTQAKIDAYTGGWLDLRGCDLKGVTLPSTINGSLYLSGCDLKGVTLPSTISGSLYLRGCDLKGVTLPSAISGSLDLSGCDLKGVTLPSTIGGFDMPTASQQKKNLVAVAKAALLTAGNGLEMETVHTCETTHCMAGWACVLDPQGRKMESSLGWETAGLMLLGAEAHSLFYADNKTATAFLQRVLQREGEA